MTAAWARLIHYTHVIFTRAEHQCVSVLIPSDRGFLVPSEAGRRCVGGRTRSGDAGRFDRSMAGCYSVVGADADEEGEGAGCAGGSASIGSRMHPAAFLATRHVYRARWPQASTSYVPSLK